MDPARLRVFAVHAVVPLVGVGHGHDLARVRRVGQDLLVAGHRRVEHGLAEGLPGSPEPAAPERGAVLEDQERGSGRHLAAFPSCTTSSPRYIVWITRPRSVRPRKAEFLLF